MGGVYNEYVSFPNSGTASEPITFQSDPCSGWDYRAARGDRRDRPDRYRAHRVSSRSREHLSYITVKGFEIRNLSFRFRRCRSVRRLDHGSGTGIQILNNLDAQHCDHSEKEWQRLRHGLRHVEDSDHAAGHQRQRVYDNRTGNSESLTINGNVTHFQVTNNLVHDNDNIGIDAIGFEGTGPVGYDQASMGW
jgi:hypothetical protein